MSEKLVAEKIRLLFLCPGYARISRGVEVFLHELVERIDKTRFDVTILCCGDGRNDGVRFIRIQALNRSRIEPYDGGILLKLLKLLRLGSSTEIESFVFSLGCARHLFQNRYDLMFPFGGYWSFQVTALLKKSAKIVSIGHAGPVRCELKFSDAFVAITDFALGQAREMVPQMPMAMIPNGVDLAKFHPVGGPRGERPPTILCVAAFAVDKRHDLLFDAMIFLDRSVRLLCVGPGVIPVQLSQHPLCSSHKVEFRCVTHEEMPEIYREADVFTLPAPEEAFGIVFLEALATGLNVVAHDGPRQRSVIGTPGFYCNVFDSKGYAEVLKKALTTSHRDMNIKQASVFGWNKIVQRYQEFLSSLVLRRLVIGVKSPPQVLDTGLEQSP